MRQRTRSGAQFEKEIGETVGLPSLPMPKIPPMCTTRNSMSTESKPVPDIADVKTQADLQRVVKQVDGVIGELRAALGMTASKFSHSRGRSRSRVCATQRGA